MSWTPTLTLLRTLLQGLFSTQDSARTIVDEAGIPTDNIAFSTASQQNWHAILREADKCDKVLALLDVALQHYPEQHDLHAAREAYRATKTQTQTPLRNSEDTYGLVGPRSVPRSTDPWRPAHVDLAIVTALYEELEPVLNLVGGRSHWTQFSLDQFIHYHTTFVCGAQSLSVIASALWNTGSMATTAQVLRLTKLHPRMLAMTGICAGWQDQAIALGDVIVADRAFHSGAGKQTPAGLLPDTRTYQSPPWLIGLLNDFASNQTWSHSISTLRPHSLRYQADWLLCQIAERGPTFPATARDWQELEDLQIDAHQIKALLQTKGFVSKSGKLTAAAQKRLTELQSRNYGTLAPLPDHAQPRVHYKAFASSEAVIAVTDPFSDLAKRVRNIGALEMEVAALFAAALESGLPAFAVKGVSDYGTIEKDDLFHTYAAEASARWMHAFICANADTLLLNTSTILDRNQFRPVFKLHQLRTPVADFVGRTEEVEQLVFASSNVGDHGARTALISIRGMGGIGKTEVAYAVAERLAPYYPDAQLVLSLGGASARPLSPKEALQQVIQTFAPEIKLPDDLNQLESLYRSQLADKRVLILVDDAKDQAQVRLLQPPSGSVLLMTSRNRFTLPGSTTLDLEVLSEAAAITLLRGICSRIATHASRLAKLCGNLPLALRVSAALLENDDTRSVTHYLEQLTSLRLRYLSDPDTPNDPAVSVEASLQLSYTALPAPTQRALAQLSVFTASFDRAAARAVVETAEDVEELLGTLRLRSLLEWKPDLERYQLHDLVRVFASNQLPPDQLINVQQRYVHHYLQFVEEARAELTGLQQHSWFNHLDREYVHLQNAMNIARTTFNIEIHVRLTNALWRFWETRGYFVEGKQQLSIIQAAIEQAAETSDNIFHLADVLKYQGALSIRQGDYQLAQRFLEKSLDIYRRSNDAEYIMKVLVDLGLAYYYQTKYRQAKQCNKEAYRIAQQVDHKKAIATIQANNGLISQDQGDFNNAERFLRTSIELYQALQEDAEVAKHKMNLANTLRYQKKFEPARLLLEESMMQNEHVRDPWVIASAYNSMGWLMLDYNEHDKASQAFLTSLKQFQNIDDSDGVVWCIEGIAAVLLESSIWEEATRLFAFAAHFRKILAVPLPPVEKPLYDERLERLHQNLDNEHFARLWTEGQTVTLEQATAIAYRFGME